MLAAVVSNMSVLNGAECETSREQKQDCTVRVSDGLFVACAKNACLSMSICRKGLRPGQRRYDTADCADSRMTSSQSDAHIPGCVWLRVV